MRLMDLILILQKLEREGHGGKEVHGICDVYTFSVTGVWPMKNEFVILECVEP
jgi:hypothetical protein